MAMMKIREVIIWNSWMCITKLIKQIGTVDVCKVSNHLLHLCIFGKWFGVP